MTGERNSTERLVRSFSYDLSLSANSFTFARGYGANVAGMHPLDIRSTVIQRNKSFSNTISSIV